MNQSTQTTNEVMAPYSTVGKDLQVAVMAVSLLANLFVFTAWLVVSLSK